MRIVCLVFVCGLFLSACAGSAYRLPPVSEAETQAMQQRLSQHRVPPQTHLRSDRQNEKLLIKINNRLIAKAQPLCDYAGYPSCFFQTEYSSGDAINAYASEGYKITIYRGLMQYLESEDEIAAVVAHEMGHHLAHHNEESMDNAMTGAAIGGILTAVLVGAANANNPYYSSYQQHQDSQAISGMMDTGAAIGAISYSKEQEREADLLGAYLMSAAGYDLEKAQKLFFILSKLPGERDRNRTGLTDTHPISAERLVAWEKAIHEVRNNPRKLPYAKQPAQQVSPKRPARP